MAAQAVAVSFCVDLSAYHNDCRNGEIVVRQLGNTKLDAMFPSITPEIYSPATKLNIVNGPDLDRDYTSTVGQMFVPLLRR